MFKEEHSLSETNVMKGKEKMCELEVIDDSLIP